MPEKHKYELHFLIFYDKSCRSLVIISYHIEFYFCIKKIDSTTNKMDEITPKESDLVSTDACEKEIKRLKTRQRREEERNYETQRAEKKCQSRLESQPRYL